MASTAQEPIDGPTSGVPDLSQAGSSEGELRLLMCIVQAMCEAQ